MQTPDRAVNEWGTGGGRRPLGGVVSGWPGCGLNSRGAALLQLGSLTPGLPPQPTGALQ